MRVGIPTEDRIECFKLIAESGSNYAVVSMLLFLLEDYLIPLFAEVDGYYFSVYPALPYNMHFISYSFSAGADAEISIVIDTNKNFSQTLLEVLIFENSQSICIPKIMIHESIRHRGVGKKMIEICFKVARHFGYRLRIVQMVDSFFNRMLKRGAKQLDYDEVEITESTDLSPHYPCSTSSESDPLSKL